MGWMALGPNEVISKECMGEGCLQQGAAHVSRDLHQKSGFRKISIHIQSQEQTKRTPGHTLGSTRVKEPAEEHQSSEGA
jgi:hypothetical protein